LNEGVVDGVGVEDSVFNEETVETAVLVELWLIEEIDVWLAKGV
jgi:hypothetical protein